MNLQLLLSGISNTNNAVCTGVLSAALHHCALRRGNDQSGLGSFEHLRCLTATLHTTQQKNQRVFWGCDQNPSDATIVTIDGLNSFMLVFLDLMTQDLFSALMSFIILQSNKCPLPAGG